MGCINNNGIIKPDISQQLNNEEIFKQSIKEENIFKRDSLKNSKNNYYKSNNLFYDNSNNSGSNVTSNNKFNNNTQTKNNTINSLISNDYFNNKYTLLGEINNQQNVEEFKIQLKSNPAIVRCMRKIPKNLTQKNNIEEEDNFVFEEVNLLKSINHKNICQLYECINTPNNYFLIMDYCKEGYLDNKLKMSNKYSETQIKYLAFQLFSAVQHLNQNNYMHTDIKPTNILIDEIVMSDHDEELFNIKLLNFGSYGDFESNNSNSNVLPYYIAPEVINNVYDVTSDVWSIGVIIYQMFYGELPFIGDNLNELYSNINIGKITQTFKASSNLRDLLDLIFVKDFKNRININKCLEHNWFKVDNDTQRNSDNYKEYNNEEINTDENRNKNKINDNNNNENNESNKIKKESKKSNIIIEEKKSNKIVININSGHKGNKDKDHNKENNNHLKFIKFTFNDEQKKQRSLVLGIDKTKKEKRRKMNKSFLLIKYCILFIKYYIRIYFQKDKEIHKLNNIYLKYKIENNINLFINYINNTRKISFDSFYYNQTHSLSDKNLSNNIKNKINNKEELFKILIENKRKYIEMNLKKYFGKLKKSTVDEIKNIFKESNNINLKEIQKYKLYFNEIEFEMEKNKYKQIYLYMDFYKLLINSINKLNSQLITNNISTNADSNNTNANININTNANTSANANVSNITFGINKKSIESNKNVNIKEVNEKSIIEQKYENQNKNNENNNNDNNNNIIKNNNNTIIEKISNNNLIEKKILDNQDNGDKKKKKYKLNKTNIIKKTKSFNEITLNANKNRRRKSFKEFIKNNYEKINDMINEKKNDINIQKNNENIGTDFDDDYYETEKRKNDKNRFDPEKFLAIIGFS
jgi:serine/threonine protein kinase